LAVTACLTAFSPSFTQTSNDVDALTKKEQAAREKANALENERLKIRKDVANLKKTLVKTARQTRTIEIDLTVLERETESLSSRAIALNNQIDADRARYTDLIAALQRLQSSPPPTLALTPRDAKRASDAGLLMATLSNQLKKRADALALNLTALEVTQAQLVLKKKDLSSTRTKLKSEMKSVNAGLASKSKLEAQIADEKKTAAAEADRLAAESKTLLELIAKLEKEAAKPVPRTKPGRKLTAELNSTSNCAETAHLSIQNPGYRPKMLIPGKFTLKSQQFDWQSPMQLAKSRI